MQVPEEALDKGLTPREFYLLAVMYRHVDRWGDVNLTSEELEKLTSTSRTTVWRDMTALEDAGLVETERTRRNYNKFYKNRYRLISPCFQPETQDENIDSLCFQPETSTAGQGSSNSYKTIIVKSLVSKTSSYLGADAPKEEIMVNRWSEDDDMPGFGLFESEMIEKAKPKKPAKARPVNRLMRPEAEWTTQDVATEFGMMMYQKVKANSGPINTTNLKVILNTFRKRYSTTASVELEVLRTMFDDAAAVSSIAKKPENGHKVYLSWLSNHMQQIANGTTGVDNEDAVYYVYASDGTEFDNSMSGKLELAKYEASLK